MNVLCAILSLLLSLTSASWAGEQNVLPPWDPNDSTALHEATRVLEEEVKLAARPQTYILIDLTTNAILIKGRGIELHRIPIDNWSASHLSELAVAYRLRERPPVNRRKLDPLGGTEQDPISLADMPTTFALHFSPPMTILVLSSNDGHPWQWATQRGHEWWRRLTAWSLTLWTGEKPPSLPSLDLTISSDHAQSLAWTVTENMPFLIHRTTRP